jgi:hypothetical protein
VHSVTVRFSEQAMIRSEQAGCTARRLSVWRAVSFIRASITMSPKSLVNNAGE